ncbi:MAG: DNA recombination protein RmuC [Deltaproteobacteria bacterium]|nr:DNA recombination protein RmuC [Deltaproteobacteria bacterium]
MNLPPLLWGLAIGLIAGVFLAWLFFHLKTAQKISQATLPFQSQLAVIEERLKAREAEIQGLAANNRESGQENESLRQRLLQESQERAAAQKEVEQLAEWKERLQEREKETGSLREEITGLKQNRAEIETTLRQERKAMEEKIIFLNETAQKMEDAFKVLSAECLRTNNQQFLDLAKTHLEKFQSEAKGDLDQRQKAVEGTIAPLKETLDKYVQQVQEMETARQQAYGSLSQHLEMMSATEQRLQTETGNLVKALRAPQVRGRWGELTLKRVAELAGMSEHCDFIEQESVTADEGRLRPDMIVRLPNRKWVVVDAKSPLQAYLESLECPTEEERKIKLREHTRQIQTHMQKLSSKSYWDQFPETPEFVVLFLPGENFFSAALEQNPNLIEEGVNQKVILSTPTTLITLLRAVAYGWRQEALAENAQAISELGKTLYERLVKLALHFGEVGRSLDKSVHAYNDAVGSLESRVLVAARRFKELGISSKAQVPEIGPIEKNTRNLQSPEFCAEIEEDIRR